MLLAFALGRAIPIALGAVAVSWLKNLERMGPWRRAFGVAGGVLLIVMGLYMLNTVLFWVPGLA